MKIIAPLPAGSTSPLAGPGDLRREMAATKAMQLGNFKTGAEAFNFAQQKNDK